MIIGINVNDFIPIIEIYSMLDVPKLKRYKIL